MTLTNPIVTNISYSISKKKNLYGHQSSSYLKISKHSMVLTKSSAGGAFVPPI